MTDTPPPAAPPAAATDTRLTKLEKEQERQGGVLDELLSLVKGDGSKDGGAATGDPAPPAQPDIAEQVRQAVREVNAERVQADAAAAHDADHARLRQPAPETPPREATGRRALFQGIMFGSEPKPKPKAPGNS